MKNNTNDNQNYSKMQNVISKINSVDIVTVDSDGEIFVPIKPICEAIGIDVESQRDKINSDEILSSTAVLSTAVAADARPRKPSASSGQSVSTRSRGCSKKKHNIFVIFSPKYLVI